MNNVKTFLLLAGLTALLFFIGGLLGGQIGLIISLALSVVMNIVSYWYSDKIVLNIYQAKEVHSLHVLHKIVKELSHKADIPMPKVYLINSETPNAFATGRNPDHASVAATQGLLNRLTQEELIGVMAHEIAHVAHRDTLIMAVSATIGGAISGIANLFMFLSFFSSDNEEKKESNSVVGILLMILAPIAAMIIQMSISRSREYIADEGGAKLCGHPEWLASALERLESEHATKVMPQVESHPTTAHLFIINPLKGQDIAQLFSTHPLTLERVIRLRNMKII